MSVGFMSTRLKQEPELARCHRLIRRSSADRKDSPSQFACARAEAVCRRERPGGASGGGGKRRETARVVCLLCAYADGVDVVGVPVGVDALGRSRHDHLVRGDPRQAQAAAPAPTATAPARVAAVRAPALHAARARAGRCLRRLLGWREPGVRPSAGVGSRAADELDGLLVDAPELDRLVVGREQAAAARVAVAPADPDKAQRSERGSRSAARVGGRSDSARTAGGDP